MTFKTIVKMKTGGSVAKAAEYTKRERKEVGSEDIAQDKKIVKKAISIHDKQQHEAPTDLSKLKKGGRAKKEVGTVKKYCGGSGVQKYKTGGNVTNVYDSKKSAADRDNIKKVKQQVPAKLCGGKSVKKYENGGSVLDTIKNAGKKLYENVMGTPEQNAAAKKSLDKVAEGQGAISDVERGIRSITGKKSGGKC